MTPKISVPEFASEKSSFDATLPNFINYTVEIMKTHGDSISSQWFEKVMRRNITDRMPYRGVLSVVAFRILADEAQLTQETLDEVRFVAWCSKMAETASIIADDIVDQSQMRAGAPCWHVLDDVGLQSVNDALWLNSALLLNLHSRIGNKEYFKNLSRMFVEGTCAYYHGQTLDYINSKKSIREHSKDLYDGTTVLKTGISACYLPVAVALVMSGCKDPKIYETAKEILTKLGSVWQCRNDYMDCFGDGEKNVGGTDISENKMTWLTVNAMLRANEDQKLVLQKLYGQKDKESIQSVKAIFEELGLKQLYLETQEECLSSLKKMIEKSPCPKLNSVLNMFLGLVFCI